MNRGEVWREGNTRARAAIRDEEEFERSNSRTLVGYHVDGALPDEGVGLTGADARRWDKDCAVIRYLVTSYQTPIHWVTLDGRKYTIKNPPTKTTAGHRNLCPGYKQYREGKNEIRNRRELKKRRRA